MPKNPLYVEQVNWRNDLTTAPSTNGEIRYVSGTGFQMYNLGSLVTIPTSAGSTTYNNIGDPSASGSISFGTYTGTYTSTAAAWGGLILSNTHANPTAGASLLNLDYTANGDANGVFIDCTDNAGADSKFLVGLDGATVITGTATGTDALTLTAGDITVSDGDVTLSTGNLVLTLGSVSAPAGLAVGADNVNATFGASGATDSKIYFDGAGNLTFYDSTAGVVTLSECLSTLGPDPTVTGNLTITDGKIIWTNGADEEGGAFTFANTTGNDITWVSAATTGNCLSITADPLTSGSMIYLDTLAAGFTGEYLRCFDGTADDFSVGVAGLTTIAGAAAGTDALVVTVGDFLFNDSDQNIIESEDGALTLLLLDNKAGAIGAGEAVLKVDAGGVVNAAGFGLDVRFTGASAAGATLANFVADAGSVGMFINCGSVDTRQAFMIDADPTAYDVASIHSDAVMADNKAMLLIDHATGASAAGSNLFRIVEAATPNAGAIGFEMDVQVDMIAVSIDTNAATNDAFYVTHSGNLAAGKAVMHVTDGGVPAADNVYVGHFAFTGTDTAESAVLFADGGGKDVTGLLIDVDPVYSAANYAGHLTMYSNAAGDLPVFMSMIHEDAGAVSGEYCSKIFFYGSDDAPARELYASIEVEMDDTAAANPDGILWIKGDLAGTNTNSAGFTGNTVMLGAAAATLTTAGAWDLTISTALTAAGEPRIVLTDGTAGNVTVTAGNVSGEIVLASPVAHSSTETITASTGGALALTTSVSLLETDGGGDAYTLAAGVAGQIKFVTLITFGGGNGVLTLTGNPAAYDVITFTAVGQSALLVYTATGWMPISLQGCTIA